MLEEALRAKERFTESFKARRPDSSRSGCEVNLSRFTPEEEAQREAETWRPLTNRKRRGVDQRALCGGLLREGIAGGETPAARGRG